MTVILHGKNNIIIYIRTYHRKIVLKYYIRDYMKFDILKIVFILLYYPHPNGIYICSLG